MNKMDPITLSIFGVAFGIIILTLIIGFIVVFYQVNKHHKNSEND